MLQVSIYNLLDFEYYYKSHASLKSYQTQNYEHTNTTSRRKEKGSDSTTSRQFGSSQQDTKQRSPSPPPRPPPPRPLTDDTKVDDAPEIETKSTKPAVTRLVSAPTTEGSKISDAILEQIVNCLNEMNMESEFPCTPNVAACYAMFYLHVVDGYPYEDLTVDDVVNWFFGNGKDKDKTNWASGLPSGFKRVKDGYIVSTVIVLYHLYMRNRWVTIVFFVSLHRLFVIGGGCKPIFGGHTIFPMRRCI